VTCAECDRMLVIAPHPTVEETRVAAAAGNPSAIRNLPHAEAAAAYSKRFNAAKLTDPAQLPEIAGDGDLHMQWDTIDGPEVDSTTTILHEDDAIWSEPAVFEGAWRFAEVAELLKLRYGERFRTLTPTDRSGVYLWGDRATASIGQWFRREPE
jgi:hypothetical protein